jgi:hypothetical protein
VRDNRARNTQIAETHTERHCCLPADASSARTTANPAKAPEGGTQPTAGGVLACLSRRPFARVLLQRPLLGCSMRPCWDLSTKKTKRSIRMHAHLRSRIQSALRSEVAGTRKKSLRTTNRLSTRPAGRGTQRHLIYCYYSSAVVASNQRCSRPAARAGSYVSHRAGAEATGTCTRLSLGSAHQKKDGGHGTGQGERPSECRAHRQRAPSTSWSHAMWCCTLLPPRRSGRASQSWRNWQCGSFTLTSSGQIVVRGYRVVMSTKGSQMRRDRRHSSSSGFGRRGSERMLVRSFILDRLHHAEPPQLTK